MRQVARSEAEFQQWPVLEPLEGERERPVALNKPVCVAGDRVRVNLPLPSETVSRAHVLFVADEEGVYLRDLASLNHVMVNEKPVHETVLDAGDVLRIGPYAFRCEGGFRHNGHEHPQVPPAELRLADDGTPFPLSGRTTVIGKRKDCDIRLSDEKAAPAHAVIFERQGRRFIRDLRARGGVFVNDRRVGQVELTPGDYIRIGDTNFRYQAAESENSDSVLAEAIMPEAEPQAPMESPPTMEEAAPAAQEQEEQQEQQAVPVGDWDIIPLLDEPAAAKPAAEPPPPTPQPKPIATSASEDSGVIPLADSSELPAISSPAIPGGIPDADEIPMGIALQDDSAIGHSIGPGGSHPGQISSKSGESPLGPPHADVNGSESDENEAHGRRTSSKESEVRLNRQARPKRPTS